MTYVSKLLLLFASNFLGFIRVCSINFHDIVHLCEKLLSVRFVDNVNEVVQAIEELYQLPKVGLKLRQSLNAFLEDLNHVFLQSKKKSQLTADILIY